MLRTLLLLIAFSTASPFRAVIPNILRLNAYSPRSAHHGGRTGRCRKRRVTEVAALLDEWRRDDERKRLVAEAAAAVEQLDAAAVVEPEPLPSRLDQARERLKRFSRR